MKKEFVSYELALRMKVLGFDEHCFGIYDMDTKQFIQNTLCIISDTCTNENMKCISDVNWITAPLFSQAFRWFREKYGLIGDPIPLSTSKNGPTTHYGWGICSSIDAGVDWENDDDGFKTYEEAGLACLEQLIEIVEGIES
jgi:hypothetical protein